MTPPFEAHGVTQKIPRRALWTISSVSFLLGEDPEIVIFPSDVESPWVCFNVGDRKFGIWKETFVLYEADADGAMGEDPIIPEEIRAR